ncbi:MAG: MFS transporter [Actinomycetota bacterium]|nr:MFS transporter [Actinomycetota bacterium]
MAEQRVPNRWLMLVVGMTGQIAGTVFLSAVPFLIPLLHLQRGVPLVNAGLIASAPLIGMMLTLIAWGAVVDRIGEHKSMTIGLALITIGAFCAAFSTSYVGLAIFLFLGGMGGASANSASGRIVVGWFPADRRGFAMGIRQMAQPLGVGLAALTIPITAEKYGLQAALLVPAFLCAGALVLSATLIVDPPRATREEAAGLGHLVNPYTRDGRLWRIHIASMLLVIPQFTVWTYALVWLISEKGWTTAAASAVVAAIQVLGALGRVVAGHWSDRAGSRLGPMRMVAVAAAVSMLALGVLEGTSLAVALLVVASIVTVADNGLAFTSVAEIGGPYWSGRAMGTQNTGQFLASAAVPPLVGAAIAGHGYGFGFAVVAIFPLLAIPLVPVKGEKSHT